MSVFFFFLAASASSNPLRIFLQVVARVFELFTRFLFTFNLRDEAFSVGLQRYVESLPVTDVETFHLRFTLSLSVVALLQWCSTEATGHRPCINDNYFWLPLHFHFFFFHLLSLLSVRWLGG